MPVTTQPQYTHTPSTAPLSLSFFQRKLEEGKYTVGWKARIDGEDYGDFMTVHETFENDIKEATEILFDQAKDVIEKLKK